MIKIAYDANNIFGHSGIETYTRELLINIAKSYQTDEFTLFTSKADLESLQKFFSAQNIIVNSKLWEKLTFGKPFRFLTKILNNNIIAGTSAELDLFHQTNQFFILKKIKNLVVTIHDLIPLDSALYPETGKFHKRYKKKIDYIMHNALKVFVPSLAVRQDIGKFYTNFVEKVIVTPEAASETFRFCEMSKETINKFNLNKIENYFIFVGRMDKRKNLINTLVAYTNLDKRIKQEVKFMIVGNAGDKDKKEIFNKFNQEKENIIFINSPSNKELAELYSNAAAFVFPSLSEGFGLPVLEAMQCKCPVICSNTTSIPEVAGESAILINPLEIDEISSAMKKIIEDETLRQTLIESGLERSKLFSWQKTAQMTYQGYLSAIK